MTNRVHIFDTTLRDGEQSPGCSMTVEEKVRMAHKLAELGVDTLEAGFPIASDGDFEAVDRISREFPTVKVAALARACEMDVERAVRALEKAARPRLHTFIATSDIHLKYKLKKTRQQALDEAVEAVQQARRHVDDVEFSAEDATRTEAEFLIEVAKATVAAGAHTVNIPDTVGYSIPSDFAETIGKVVAALGDTAIVSVHCHNDLGLANPHRRCALQPKPLVTLESIRLPLGAMFPVLGPVRLPFNQRPRVPAGNQRMSLRDRAGGLQCAGRTTRPALPRPSRAFQLLPRH